MNQTIPIRSLCLSYRGNINFYHYFLVNRRDDYKTWRRFALSCPIEKMRKGMDRSIRISESRPKYLGRHYSRLTGIYKSIKLKKEYLPIPIYVKNGIRYPVDGSKRIASLLALGRTKVLVYETGRRKHQAKWNTNHSTSGFFLRICRKISTLIFRSL